jgi:hypothetical protein
MPLPTPDADGGTAAATGSVADVVVNDDDDEEELSVARRLRFVASLLSMVDVVVVMSSSRGRFTPRCCAVVSSTELDVGAVTPVDVDVDVADTVERGLDSVSLSSEHVEHHSVSLSLLCNQTNKQCINIKVTKYD